MKILRIVSTIALLSFVVATVGLLIAQEVAYVSIPRESTVETVPSLSGSDAEASSSEPAPNAQLGEIVVAEEEDGDQGSPGTASELADRGTVEQTADASSEAQVSTVSCRVDAIYFHTTFRCRTCKLIEELAQAVVETEFAEEISDGRLRWQAINMQRERDYVALYDLTRPTLVLVRDVDGETSEWTALHDTWNLLGAEIAFAAYVRDHVRSLLERCP